MEFKEKDSLSIIKGKARMKITVLDKNDEGVYKVVNEKWVTTSRKEIIDSWTEDYKNGIKHQFKIVNSKPEKFQVNVLYILADGKVLWAYVER